MKRRRTVIYWQPDDLTPGQSATYLVLDPGYPPEIVTLDNWDKRPSSLSLYLAALEELYGREVVPQFDQQLYQIGFSWENFGTIIQNTFDSLYLRLDQITGYPTS